MDFALAQKEEGFSSLTLTAVEAALQAGEILRRGFGTVFKISSKPGIHNLVTEYDHKSEQHIVRFLKEQFPKSRFLCEETGKGGNEEDSLRWIVDPLDGTVNFAHKIPMFSVSIAAELQGVITSGVVYQPITHELFIAEKGRGAFLNGVAIRVSPTHSLKDAILATGFPYNLKENPFQCIDHFVDILKLGLPIRRIGVATLDLSYTADGRYDAFFEASLAPWDCAAGLLILEEGGGKVSGWDGSPFDIHSYKPILASNGHIHHDLSLTLNRTIQ